MSAVIREIEERLLSAYSGGGRLALLLDYDGTLAPIVAHPRLARLDRGTRRLLEGLARWPRVRVGIISGRSIEDLRDMVCLPQAFLSGNSGLELDLHGLEITHPRARRAAREIERLVAGLRAMVASYPGMWIEYKGLGLTVHYRAAAPPLVDEMRRHALALAQSSDAKVKITDGPMALEMTADLGWNKGTATQMMVRHCGGNRTTVLYAGDAENDDDAFQVVASMAGISVGVGVDAPATAEYRLPDPAALVALLFDLYSGLVAGKGPANRNLAELVAGED